MGFYLYNEEQSLNELKDILKTIENNKEIVLLGEVTQKKPYCTQRVSEWLQSFPENKEMKETYRKIKDILKNRINKGALDNKYNASIARLNLSANYGMTESKEIKHSGKVGISVKQLIEDANEDKDEQGSPPSVEK